MHNVSLPFASMNRNENKRTFHELLAGVLLEEGLMSDRAVQIVDHQVEDR